MDEDKLIIPEGFEVVADEMTIPEGFEVVPDTFMGNVVDKAN